MLENMVTQKQIHLNLEKHKKITVRGKKEI